MKTIFVSSTFKDMHFERDRIGEQVLPALNKTARAYGDNISFCDLRWGVNTGDMDWETANRKVLEVCLDEIDRCRPYMVVLLGDRYGWIPEESLLRSTVADKPGFHLDDTEISATALEIEYGALSNPEQLKHTLFYFRELEGMPPDDYHEHAPLLIQKLAQLKERILSTPGAHCKSYTVRWNPEEQSIDGLDRFAQMLTEDILALMQPEWQALSVVEPLEQERRIQWEYARQNAQRFDLRQPEVDTCRELLEHGAPFYLITDVPGSGKTMFLSKLAIDMQDAGYDVLALFCGYTNLSNHMAGILRQIVFFLENGCGTTHLEDSCRAEQLTQPQLTRRLDELISLCNQGERRYLILVDGLELLEVDTLTQASFIRPGLSEKIGMVVTWPWSKFTLGTPQHTPHLMLKDLDIFQTERIVHSILGGMGRELDDSVVQAIYRKRDSIYPLYLDLILRRLTMMRRCDYEQIAAAGDGIQAITDYQLNLVEHCGESLEGIGGDVVTAAWERIGGDRMHQAFYYICASPSGLREAELRALFARKGMPWIGVEFAMFIQYLGDFFVLRQDGRIDLAHSFLRKMIGRRRRDYQDLLDYISDQPDGRTARCHEYIYYSIKAQNEQAYLDYICSDCADLEAAAQVTFRVIRSYWSDNNDDYEIIELWMKTLIQSALQSEARDAFMQFFTGELKTAFRGPLFHLWNGMSHEIWTDDGEWRQNLLDRDRDDPAAASEMERSMEHYNHLFDEVCKEVIPSQEPDGEIFTCQVRREHAVDPAQRHGDIEAAGCHFYFYGAGRTRDIQVFLMRDDSILMKFSRSSYGDHTTYDLSFDPATGQLQVKEADFDHFSIETAVTTYQLQNPFADEIYYTKTWHWEKGARNLPVSIRILW